MSSKSEFICRHKTCIPACQTFVPFHKQENVSKTRNFSFSSFSGVKKLLINTSFHLSLQPFPQAKMADLFADFILIKYVTGLDGEG